MMMRDLLVGLATEHLPSELAEQFVSLARPAVRLKHDGQASKSWLGGDAMLEPGTDWPRWDDRPLSLVLVLAVDDLKGFATDAPLPERGLLNFFYEASDQQAWGFDPTHRDGWRVLWADDAEAVVTPAPGGCQRFERQFVSPEQILTIPGWEDGPITHPSRQAQVRRRPWSKRKEDPSQVWDRYVHFAEAWEKAVGLQEVPYHQIGGWPRLQQAPIWRECHLASQGVYLGSGTPDLSLHEVTGSEEDWRLLLQLDTDEAVGWMWGDLGTIFYAARPGLPPAERWRDTWMVFQCG